MAWTKIGAPVIVAPAAGEMIAQVGQRCDRIPVAEVNIYGLLVGDVDDDLVGGNRSRIGISDAGR